jgi:hypothetical protein
MFDLNVYRSSNFKSDDRSTMSGPFVCGMRKFDKHKMMAADRPSNNALYQENQKSLSDLIKQREQQDKGMYVPIIVPIQPPVITTNPSYTPWKTPSTS